MMIAHQTNILLVSWSFGYFILPSPIARSYCCVLIVFKYEVSYRLSLSLLPFQLIASHVIFDVDLMLNSCYNPSAFAHISCSLFE